MLRKNNSKLSISSFSFFSLILPHPLSVPSPSLVRFFFFLFRGSFLLIYFFIESSVIDLFFFVLLYLLLLSISTIFFLSFFSPTFYCYSMNNNLFKKKIMQIYRVFFSKKWHEDLEKYFIV